MKFSIIIPTYNSEKYIEQCLNSIVSQEPGGYEMEILLIDNSSDNTYQIIRKFAKNKKKWVKIFKNYKNIGPGPARNIGIESASGEWIMFLDDDDELSGNALNELCEYIRSKDNLIDMVGYNWTYDSKFDVKIEKYGGRWDINDLLKDKTELIKNYISLGIDSSAIYTVIKKSLFDVYKIRFREGLHEDIDFMLKVYFYAKNIGVLDMPLYLKNNRNNSIINSISESHIKGFFRALNEIYIFLNSWHIYTENSDYYYQGLLRAVATQVRRIREKCVSGDRADSLYFMLYKEYADILKMWDISSFCKKYSFDPKYIMIANYFLKLLSNTRKSVHKDIADYLDSIKKKSWSCYSLHYSVFLSPDEIRTCCKRFFVDNKIKGDVVLLRGAKYSYGDFTPANILKEKRELHVRINRGIAEGCIGCPYLEFKDWEAINELKIEYISFEYSSVCNMKCTYCDDKYYGGKKVKYDVEMLLKQFFEKNNLQNCNTIVWGGGELTLDSSFEKLLTFMAANFPEIKQRFFTNATKFSDIIDKYLGEGKILSITSIDAGNEKNFYKIRKHKGFRKVFENLRKYSLSGAKNMIIKYIITEHNSSLDELRSYVRYVREYSLEKCNFQISFDFKEEFIDSDALISVIALFTYLSDINVRFIFLDDLLWQRVSKELNKQYPKVLEKLEKLKLLKTLADRKKYKEMSIWGAGTQAKFLIEKSAFFEKVKIKYIVDNSSKKLGKDFFGYKILLPNVLLDSDCPVLIAAVQNAPAILENFYKLGLSNSRLIKSLVI